MMHTPLVTADEIQLADWTRTMKRSVLREMLAVVSRPGILSFAGGLPAPELFPVQQYADAAAKVLAQDPCALQYGPPYQPLKAHIVRLMAQRGVPCTEEQIFLTTGAQQGLDVLTRLLLNPGGQVIIEEMVYTGVQQVIAPFQPEILTVPTDLETGMDVDAVEHLLVGGARPTFIYAITDAHNPLGVSMSMEKRVRLVELARHYGVPIIEDDPYGFLCYGREAEPPMRALDSQWIFYLGSFSKILAPALRTGWMVAPEALIPKLTVVKEAGDLETSAFMQRSISAYLDTGHLPGHLVELCEAYGARRDTMLRALETHFPAEARWTKPTSGMFIWVELPEATDARELLQRAVDEEQVAFIPGHAFCAGSHQAPHTMRLNFSNATPEQIEEGIERLGRVIRSCLSSVP
ncbi:MAG TPA: PLP-dependent aminotransferase family protein [Ardenticatenaceae bacterium]|jgi:2-aminoadipate transaminase